MKKYLMKHRGIISAGLIILGVYLTFLNKNPIGLFAITNGFLLLLWRFK